MKKIKSEYINKEEYILEITSALHPQNLKMNIFVLILSSCMILYSGAYMRNLDTSILWFCITLLLLFGFYFADTKSIYKRTLKKYLKDYGKTDVHVVIHISKDIEYTIEKRKINLKFKNLKRIKNTKNFLILCFQNEIVPIKKEENINDQELCAYLLRKRDER